MTDRVSFKVNGVESSVGKEVTSDTTMLDHLRNTMGLHGTKYMCREGGCGACIINASTSPGSPSMSVNACLVSVTSCQGWDITTIEGLGNRRDGYHKIQKGFAENNCSQCGYCTPGWVMSLNGLLETNKDLTMLDIEKGFGSNVCRCTGYRPIAQYVKTFGKDAPKENRIEDIENLTLCKKKGKPCSKNCADDNDWCIIQGDDLYEDVAKKIILKDGKTFYKPISVSEVCTILKDQSTLSDYMLVAGNTAKGAFPIDELPNCLVDISHLSELKEKIMDQNCIFGAGLTMTEFMSALKTNSTYKSTDFFSYFMKLHDHIDLVAHHPVRNVGTIAGNLMTKYKHNSFPSDIFLLLETVGAQLTIMDSEGNKTTCTMQDFLKLDMTRKIIYNVMLPPLTDEYHLVTFKVMPRAQSAHAMINAGFLIKYDKTTYEVKEARIVYGGLSPQFIRATVTELYLVGKTLFSNTTLQGAIKVLNGELIVEDHPPEASVEYRRKTAIGLFYKGLLTMCPTSIRATKYESGTIKLREARGLSDGKQNFTTDALKYPLTKPIHKVEAMIQSAGEAVYIEDLPTHPDEVYAAFVLSTVAMGTIDSIDATDALKMKGVIACYTCKDIPGLNSFTPNDYLLYTANEEVLADGTVKYYHQPLAIVVAEDQHIADRAVKRVKVTYSKVTKPVIDVKKAKDILTRNTPFLTVPVPDLVLIPYKTISGQNTFYGQYHFTMETMVSVAKPTEEGLEVHSSTQWLEGTHLMISRALGIPQNKIDVHTRRIGGGYGMKISRSIQSAVACSLVSYKLNRPCRFIQPLTTNMEAFGKRLPCANDYTVKVSKSGTILHIDHKLYEDNGHKINESLTLFGIDAYYNCYDLTKFAYTGFNTITDNSKNTWCRSPCTLEAIAATEFIMERIAYELSLDPLQVRLANLGLKNTLEINEMVKQLKTDADYDTRRAAVDTFNAQNRWKKRGLRFSFAKWAPLGAQRLDMNLSVYQGDGSIVVTHAGVEMGQGINTKAVQIVAYYLKVPVEKIQIKANNSIIAPNSFITGGCLTTTSIIIGLRRCCEELLLRLVPIRKALVKETGGGEEAEADILWDVLIKAAYNADVDLQVHGFSGLLDIQLYDILGMALTEVEIDCLTGEYDILRTDILQDVGVSLSPEIDIGQVEGGFMMGIGYWTCEKLVYEPDTGKLLTNRTWDYHVPQMRDMPKTFNVTFKKNSYSNPIILGSKGTGEPSTCIAVSAACALIEAMAMARKDNGIPTTTWFDIVGKEVTSDTMLLDYLRKTLGLHGTKYMCREGGCGACIINASTSPGCPSMSVNACLVSVTSCQGWDITTIEGLGNRRDGYHEIQKAFAENNCSQCGYCTPGWVMSLNGLMETNKDLTMLDIEKGFGSNICRCTGYRPLAQCLKKFGKDAPKEDRIEDIENLTLCKKKGKPCSRNCADDDDWCIIQSDDLYKDVTKKIILKDGKTFYRPNSVSDVCTILKDQATLSDYMLVGGNTAKGAFPIDGYPNTLIDISHLMELKEEKIDQNCIFGAGLTLTEFLCVLKNNSTADFFSYLMKLYDHVDLVAHHPVRNVGTIAGNLMTKYKHNSFQSDIFLLLETVGAQLTIMDSDRNKRTCTMQDFLKLDMTRKIIYNVMLPPLTDEYQLVTFKVMPRAQSAHAMINAGFLIKYDKTTYEVKEARIVYGALSPQFIRATATESYLVGKKLFKNTTLQGAIKVLDGELIVEDNPPEPSVEYRRKAAIGLFYKGLLTMCPTSIRATKYESGTVKLREARGLSDGKQNFTTDVLKYPLTEPIHKVEAMIQCAGEAVYIEDLPTHPDEVYAAFVLSTVAVGTIDSIDATDALKMKGVIACYTVKDIPGLNSFTPNDVLLYTVNEEVLADGTVKYYHQPLAIVVAEDQHIAERAVKRVKVTYSKVTKPVIDVKKAKDILTRNIPFFTVPVPDLVLLPYKIISGKNTFYGQYHFTMETMVSVAKPTEEGLEVHSSTQWLEGAHIMISRALGIPQNKIDVHTRRIGGGYGMKISRSIQSAVACSLVSYKLNRPCRFIQPLTTNMEAFGKRLPCANDYTVKVNKSGKILHIDHKLYEDNGYKINESLFLFGIDAYYNCYDVTKFAYTGFNTITDNTKNTWCRSPCTLEAIAATECIMERIAYELSLDPLAVRLANLGIKYTLDINEMVKELKTDADYATRRAAVDTFNAENRWKKRGLRFSFAKWAPFGAQRLDMNLSVYQGDGSIVVTHAGVEMGQGINTKAVQIVAYYLKVPVEKIQIKANNSIIAPNSYITGGSLTTTSIIIGLRRCCEELLLRLVPIRKALVKESGAGEEAEADILWEVLIKAAYNADVDLQVHGFSGLLDIQPYDIFGIALTEVEIDCLTGEYDILRTDILQDVGVSLSPEIDIGQVEGGFIMGIGYWTCEKLVYEPDTGKLLTNRTWDYHVPQMRDIPKTFNVTFKKNSYSNPIILGSKGTGEPSTCIAVSVICALREAMAMARKDNGIPTTKWFDIDGPFSTEAVGLVASPKTKDFKFY